MSIYSPRFHVFSDVSRGLQNPWHFLLSIASKKILCDISAALGTGEAPYVAFVCPDVKYACYCLRTRSGCSGIHTLARAAHLSAPELVPIDYVCRLRYFVIHLVYKTNTFSLAFI